MSQNLWLLLLSLALLPVCYGASLGTSDADFAEEMEEELEKEGHTMDELMNQLVDVATELGEDLSLDGTDDDEMGKRDFVTHPATPYAPILDGNGDPFPARDGIWNLDTPGALKDVWYAMLKDRTSDTDYNTLLEKMKTTHDTLIATEEYKSNPCPPYVATWTEGFGKYLTKKSKSYEFTGQPYFYFDLREHDDLSALDTPDALFGYARTHKRNNRKAEGHRGFYFQGPLSFARFVKDEGIVQGVGRSLELQNNTCRLERQPMQCNWGKPRINYDARFPGVGGAPAADPMATAPWSPVAACANLYYDIDSARQGRHNTMAFIIDSGIQLAHPELVGRVDVAAEVAFQHSVEWNMHDHGTHVAGIITGARFGTATGVDLIHYMGNNWQVGAGSAAGVHAMECIKFRHAWGSYNARATLRFVVNMSMGFWYHDPNYHVNDWEARIVATSPVVVTALRQLARPGIYVAISAGNENARTEQDACNGLGTVGRNLNAWDAIMVTGAHQRDDQRAVFSNHGQCVTIHAPGHTILSSAINRLLTMDGTSQASPHVAGVMLRIMAAYPANLALPSMRVMRNFLVNLGKNDVSLYVNHAYPVHHRVPTLPITRKRLFFYCTDDALKTDVQVVNWKKSSKWKDTEPTKQPPGEFKHKAPKLGSSTSIVNKFGKGNGKLKNYVLAQSVLSSNNYGMQLDASKYLDSTMDSTQKVVVSEQSSPEKVSSSQIGSGGK